MVDRVIFGADDINSSILFEGNASAITDSTPTITWDPNNATAYIIGIVSIETADTAQTIALSSVSLVSSAPLLSVVPGVVSITAGNLTLVSSVPSLLVSNIAPRVQVSWAELQVPGIVGLFITASVITLVGSSPNLAVIGGPILVPLNSITISGAASNLSVTPGGVTVVLNNIILAGSAEFFIILDYQILPPDADVVVGSWTDELGGVTNIYQSIDEEAPSDADYIQSEEFPSTSAYKASMSIADDPAVSGSHYIEYRYQKSGTAQIDLVVRLKQGGATIATWTHTNIPATWTDASQTLTTSEADSITDYTALDLEFEANQI